VAVPKIIVADEPTGDLDAHAAAQVMSLLKRLHEELGKTLLIVTHDPKTASAAEKTLHLEKGQLVESLHNEPTAMVEALG
jgi:putative ABC transport system ATP-binding protein